METSFAWSESMLDEIKSLKRRQVSLLTEVVTDVANSV